MAQSRWPRISNQSEWAAATRHASLHERDKTLQNQTAEKKSLITPKAKISRLVHPDKSSQDSLAAHFGEHAVPYNCPMTPSRASHQMIQIDAILADLTSDLVWIIIGV
jgi:hypothetical protein